ncbi:MAG: hypothetical protein ACQESR_11650 [Planctomycetota bacterium]
MESFLTPAVLPLVGLAADRVIRDRYKSSTRSIRRSSPRRHGNQTRRISFVC